MCTCNQCQTCTKAKNYIAERFAVSRLWQNMIAAGSSLQTPFGVFRIDAKTDLDVLMCSFKLIPG